MSVQRVSIVGCGLTGCVVARELAEKGYHVTLYDRRQHIGGNLYDYTDEHGILVHRYGPHTFHTNSESVWQYVNKYGEWEPYQLVCGAVIDGVCVSTAFDFTTVDTFFSRDAAEEIKARLNTHYPRRATVTILELLDSDDPFIRRYAEFLYEKDYKLYAAKQWGTTPDRLDRSIFSRVPVRIGYKRAYFDDKYQALPKHGYVRFISNLLEHSQIRVVLGVDMTNKIHFSEGKAFLTEGVDETIVYTGALDELFGYRFGRLPYRSLRFEWKYEDTESLQDMPVVAYPQEVEYTRITEYKKLPVQDVRGSSYAVEYPLPYTTEENRMEPYYPVLTAESQAAYEQYRALAGNYYLNLFYCGRLADFKYYNMDQAIENALTRTQEIDNG